MHGVSTDRLQVSAALLTGLAEVTNASGLSYESIAGAVGLADFDPRDDEQFVNLDNFAKFLEVAAFLSADDCFGIRLGEWHFTAPAGPLAVALANAADGRTALEILSRHLSTRIDVAYAELVVESNRVVVEWGFSPLLVKRWQLADFAAASIIRLLRPIFERNWRPLAVQLVRPAPRSLDCHRRVLGRAIEFSQRTNLIAFPLDALSAAPENADPALFRLACRLLDRIQVERDRARDLITSVREEIIQALPSEDGAQLKRVARRLGISERSLQRYLSAHNTSFQQLFDETRKGLAARYLEDPGLSFSEIAYQLGFSAPSAFTRASYRWFGKKPSVVRGELRKEPTGR
ncbi:helix-turn-helix domain-containing protein [Microbaculum marinisediminis]|uniref:AraC family transcriptional regulator ligand-binding domain-containing protein n=1 Tax=Microbaculum marinisediminis TaxID=2931392 RepID=A0AAW5QVT4_9HYPH|nr:AraC family transcriptional regulator ligand-binding domain-containing protein [Microbaculum sp. A6E488]MCT8971112.1 AraC family transcriptional regulator ligand-binding domain-containing protein [Microbaculum sp. A6E488]